jgi:hypothetical protein
MQPRQSIFVGERDPAVHLFAILRRMEIVGVVKLASEARSEDAPNCGLTRARHSDKDYDHRRHLDYISECARAERISFSAAGTLRGLSASSTRNPASVVAIVKRIPSW